LPWLDSFSSITLYVEKEKAVEISLNGLY